jgi:hypothetical protein
MGVKKVVQPVQFGVTTVEDQQREAVQTECVNNWAVILYRWSHMQAVCGTGSCRVQGALQHAAS